MVIQPFEYTLKDGRKALIRSPGEEDIPGVLEYLRISAGETEFVLRYPEECDKYTPEGEKALFDRVNRAENEAMLLCFSGGVVVGICQISWSLGMKTRHRARVAIAILKDFWNQGLGTRLFQKLIEIAEADEHILQIELDYVEGNARARALYEKMGFRITGVKPNAIRLRDGTLLNEYSMIREIRR